MSNDELRRGDLVEVRSAAEILATLDERGATEELPFMPEMAASCGKRFVVDRRTEKLCDTIAFTGSRRLRDGVMLTGLRCDGSAHDNCQADCLIWWKEAWLRKVGPETPAGSAGTPEDLAALIARTSAYVKEKKEVDGELQERWACQPCKLLEATTRVGTFDPRAYVREYSCGNVSLGQFMRVTARAVVEESARKAHLWSGHPSYSGAGKPRPAPVPPLNLQPGEWVQVLSLEEIIATLDERGFNRGLWFDREMSIYCGGTYRVRRRVNHFIDERAARMLDLKSDAVTLEDVTCNGTLTSRRWFCSRATFPYWRECWLKRADTPAMASAPA